MIAYSSNATQICADQLTEGDIIRHFTGDVWQVISEPEYTSSGISSALTLLPFRNFLSSRELLHKTKAWCPNCYEEWKGSKKPIYERMPLT